MQERENIVSEQFSRTELLLGNEAMSRLRQAHAAVFGIGGVGGHVVEALARSGIGAFDLIDNDKICLSNLNRQIIATRDTVGEYKTDVMKKRILSINPEAKVEVHHCFYLPENADLFDFANYSYIVDAVDTVTAKIELVLRAQKAGVPIISCMGTGNKLNPMQLEMADIYQTSVCPLAKVMRRELRKRDVKKLRVLYSKEEPVKPTAAREEIYESGRRCIPGSVSFVPSAAGLIIASEIVRELSGVIPKS